MIDFFYINTKELCKKKSHTASSEIIDSNSDDCKNGNEEQNLRDDTSSIDVDFVDKIKIDLREMASPEKGE